MSVWNGLLNWAIVAAKSEAQELALKALKSSMADLTDLLHEHAPDVAPNLVPLVEQVAQGAVAGILSKNVK